MAVTGLHNVSVLESPFHREAQSSTSSQVSDEGLPRIPASSLLQMWREIEDEHAVSFAEGVCKRSQQHRNCTSNADILGLDFCRSQETEQGSGLEAVVENESVYIQNHPDSHNMHEDSNVTSEQSHHYGEIERERVRRIFREWMDSGSREHASCVSQRNSSSRAQWLGENERERVRIVRDWIQMASQHRGSGSSEEQADDICAQIEVVREGFVVNNNDGQTEHFRKNIHRLCGRQALQDMIVRSKKERHRELQGLLEHKSVSSFPYRNRIQSLLRGRFLRTESLTDNERQTSLAASELGFLRQRHTVSGLREGFLSKLDNLGSVQGNSDRFDTSPSATSDHGTEETQADNSLEVLGQVLEQSNHRGDLMCATLNIVNSSESATARERQPSTNIDPNQKVNNTDRDIGRNRQESSACISSEATSEVASGETVHLQEASDLTCEVPEPSDMERNVHVILGLDGSEGSSLQNTNEQEFLVECQGQVMENEERDRQRLSSIDLTDSRGNATEDMDITWEQSGANTLLESASGNEGGEHGYQQEIDGAWHDDGLEEAVEHSSEGPAREVTVGRRVDPYFLPDDDDVYSTELRELLSRRSVSNLLQSGFRESLDHLIQSYVERQGQVDAAWEVHRMLPSSASAEEDQDLQSEDQNDGHLDSFERTTPLVSSLSGLESQQPWDHELHNANWLQDNMHQHLTAEWDIINDLRVGMARLQQRVNNMQRMLEACMDMQLELQRSVRQEVSAALNRFAGSPELSEDNLPKDGSKWDHVRKGICCICCHSNIDSLLYRCGHMCTCSRCANELVHGRGKCPMCQAPVIEVIRAYSIQ